MITNIHLDQQCILGAFQVLLKEKCMGDLGGTRTNNLLLTRPVTGTRVCGYPTVEFNTRFLFTSSGTQSSLFKIWWNISKTERKSLMNTYGGMVVGLQWKIRFPPFVYGYPGNGLQPGTRFQNYPWTHNTTAYSCRCFNLFSTTKLAQWLSDYKITQVLSKSYLDVNLLKGTNAEQLFSEKSWTKNMHICEKFVAPSFFFL